MPSAAGFIIAAPASGSGKTTITLALLRALSNAGIKVTSAKAGPDYIDPAYHSAASGRPCLNLDAWAMSAGTFNRQLTRLREDGDMIIAEGVMGLFDGAPDGSGSAADLCRRTGWPIVLVVDASGMAASIAALVHGFVSFDPGVKVAGVILNRVGSDRHAKVLRTALSESGVPVLGALVRHHSLSLPERHLGLVQAREHHALEQFLDNAAERIANSVDLQALQDLARTGDPFQSAAHAPVQPLGQHIAIAQDDAFAFTYRFQLDAWHEAGAELSFFSPLSNERPAAHAKAVFLPGGYPELHGDTLATASRFKSGLRRFADAAKPIYGECGGYMVLGECFVDGQGKTHPMCNLLPVRTSFAEPRLTLGYRQVRLKKTCALGEQGTNYRGHEFHFAAEVKEAAANLFDARNASGEPLGDCGAWNGSVAGSFIHLVDRA